MEFAATVQYVTVCAIPFNIVTSRGGFEPATSCVTGWRSNQSFFSLHFPFLRLLSIWRK
jgi:hypothetical protein